MGNLNQTDDPFCLASVQILLISFSGETSIWKANSPVEPAWITTLKQRQRGFVSQFFKKHRTRSEISVVTKDSRYEVKYNLALETVPKVSGACTGNYDRHAVTISYWDH